jgi:predicted transcriptional regulator
MFLRVIEGFIRVVIVNRAVVLMMVVVDALIMLQLVDERDRVRDRRQAALHGETIQWQTQQQKYVDNPAHGNHQANV